jgi:neutral ceramidase
VNPGDLLAGAAEVDITPPVGTALAGSIKPRKSDGVQDPLTAKAIVLSSGGVKLAYVLLDLIALERKEGDVAVSLAARRTGIPEQRIVWAASHTHTGPYTTALFEDPSPIDTAWLASIPGKFADAVEAACRSMRPARMSRERAYCQHVVHNRRYKYKDGREINTWLLHAGEEEVQCLGAAAPIDPEVGILCFDDADGVPIAVLWHYSLHTNANFGSCFSADYPAVVAARLRERFGPEVVPIFVPGTFGDINPNAGYREVGDALARVIIQRLEKRKPGLESGAGTSASPLPLGALKQEITVPWRDLTADPEARIRASQWSPEVQEDFRREVERMRRAGRTEDRTVLQAWRIGDVAFASLPGEVFVEWGLKIKAESPFPWTFCVELGGDYLGYMVTEQAWRAGGYESLVAWSARPSVDGVAMMVEADLALLRKLWVKGCGE